MYYTWGQPRTQAIPTETIGRCGLSTRLTWAVWEEISDKSGSGTHVVWVRVPGPCVRMKTALPLFPPISSGWFGIRKTFTDLILDCCPLLQEYANVSYVKEDEEVLTAVHLEEDGSRHEPKRPAQEAIKPNVYPYEDIYIPD